MKKLAAFLVYLLAFVVIIAMMGLFAGFWISHSEKNLYYVYVGDLNVSGKTSGETEALLQSGGWGDRETSPLVVTTFRGERFEVDPIRSGVATPVETLVKRAHDVGHDEDMISSLFTAAEVYRNPVDVARTAQAIDYDYLDGLIDNCVARVQSNMGSEDYTVDKEASSLVMIKGRNQLNFDKLDFRNTIITALKLGQREIYYNRLVGEIPEPDFQAIYDKLWQEPSDAYYVDNVSYQVSRQRLISYFLECE